MARTIDIHLTMQQLESILTWLEELYRNNKSDSNLAAIVADFQPARNVLNTSGTLLGMAVASNNTYTLDGELFERARSYVALNYPRYYTKTNTFRKPKV